MNNFIRRIKLRWLKWKISYADRQLVESLLKFKEVLNGAP